MLIYAVLGLLAIFVIGGVLIYNNLVKKSQMADNGWSDIDVQLKRRANLIPQLVSTVEGYASHEQKLFAEVATRRAEAMAAGDDVSGRSAAETALSQPVSRLVAVAEDYPELKASDNFLELQRELSDTEDKIEMARRFYNGAVRELNTSVQSFPAMLIAGPLGFRQRDYFEVDMADRAVPQIDMGDQA